MNFLYAFLSWDWAGVVLSMVLAATGWWLWRLRRQLVTKHLRTMVTILGIIFLGLGSLLTITSSIHAVSVEMAFSKFPAPGKLVDVGGYDMHLLAEGENSGQPTLLWIPGGHSFGFNFYNMHKLFREQTRSIIFDRLSTGWSELGPYPRTSHLEVEELHRMLKSAGETDPLILVGHSYGGLLAALYAMKHPERISALVLLDSGLPINWENPVAANFMLQYSRLLFWDGLLQLFGIPLSLQTIGGGDALKDLLAIYERELQDVWPQITGLSKASMNAFGTASIFSEIGKPEFFEQGADIPGVLDSKPLLYITFLGGEDLSSAKAKDIVKDITGLDEAGVESQISGLRRNRQAMSVLSNRFRSISVPDGASHNFPYETPDFVAEQVRLIMDEVKAEL